ncbi:MAG: nucleotide exchange factor GrpE [Clostridia bacterium]|nr:nucleotide exchange factor GrpE [Clostridia bacterium]
MEQTENINQEEITEEIPAEAQAETQAPAEPSELDKALALAEDYKRKWYAVTAEYDNYRKRTANTASQKYAEGIADIVLKILPIGDNIDRALAVCTDEKMKQGLEMVKTSFDKTLLDEGIEGFDPTGEEFDSTTSAAIAALPCEEGEAEGIVKQTFLKGYKKGDKILRFAQVIVTR